MNNFDIDLCTEVLPNYGCFIFCKTFIITFAQKKQTKNTHILEVSHWQILNNGVYASLNMLKYIKVVSWFVNNGASTVIC